MNFRCTDEQKEAIETKAAEYGFDSVGAYIKFTSINAHLAVSVGVQKTDTASVKSINDTDIDKKIKAYKLAYIENYTYYSAETNEKLLKAKDILCTAKPSKEDVFTMINKMSNVTGSNKSKKLALKNEEKYVFQIIELFRIN